MENPWDAGTHNLSAYERNGVLLNAGEGNFVDISYLSGADLDSDSRSVVSVDLNHDGMQDVILRSNGGGPIHVFENRFPKTNWLEIGLRGTKSNSTGIGAKLKVEIGDRVLHREFYPHCAFRSQLARYIHFGLGASEKVDRLTIRWPSGVVQILEDVSVNQHLKVTEPSQ